MLKKRHKIPVANFIGHADIAPGRKVDPNPNFPWEKLAEEGFGHWYDEEVIKGISRDSIAISEVNIESEISGTEMRELGKSADSLHLNMDPKLAMRVIGYDVSDLDAAIRSFKIHFIQKEINSGLTEEDLKILYNLYRKYL